MVTTTGGGGAMAVDRLGDAGIAVEGASDALRAHVKEAVGLSLKPARLIDVTLAGARYEVMKTVLDGLLDSGDYAAVVAAIGSSAQFLPERAVQPIVDCAGHATPIAAAPLPQADRALAMLSEAEVAGFRSVESMADAVRAFIEWTPPKPLPTDAPPEIGPARPGAVLGEADGLALLDRLGLTTVGRRLLGVDEAIPDDIAYPVVLKAVSADLPHKTEAGAVALGLADRPALEAARDAMRTHLKTSAPGAVLEGWLVQTMVRGLGEALVGYRVDPEVGPVISVAPGGIYAELYEDVAVRTAPGRPGRRAADDRPGEGSEGARRLARQAGGRSGGPGPDGGGPVHPGPRPGPPRGRGRGQPGHGSGRGGRRGGCADPLRLIARSRPSTRPALENGPPFDTPRP